MAVKNRLKVILDERGIKYSFMADKIGMNKGTFSNLINNKFSTSMDYAFKLKKELGLEHIEDMFYEEEE